MVAGTIGQDGGIDHLAARATFPSIECPDEIVELLGIHAALAFRALHDPTSWSMSELPSLAYDFSPGNITQAVPAKQKGASMAPYRLQAIDFFLLFTISWHQKQKRAGALSASLGRSP
jgi:hypothetical protein